MFTIADVDFGRIDADFEVSLSEYFVDMGVVRRIREGRRSLVLGRKGSGKTAVHKYLSDQTLGQAIKKLDFSEYPWEMHKRIKESGMPEETAYTSSWRFLIVMTLMEHLELFGGLDTAKRAKEYRQRIFRGDNPGALEILVDKFKRLRRVDLPSAEGVFTAGGVELDDPDSQGPLLANAVGMWAKEFESFIKDHFHECPVTLSFDRLDDGWDATSASKALLVGMLRAARDVNLRMGSPNRPPIVLTFLRSDIFDELTFNDKNKLSEDIERLTWKEEALVSVIEARIRRSANAKEENLPGAPWDAVFSDTEMRQRAIIKTYIVKRTMGRPRDIVAFCKECQTIAVDDESRIVETDHVYDAEEAYSRHVYDELVDEMHKQLPEAKEYFQAIREIGRLRFTAQEWDEVMRRRKLSNSMQESLDSLKVLFDYAIVGVLRKGGKSGGAAYQYIYSDRLLEPNFEVEVQVHPALKKELRLVEARAKDEQ
jgi:hypothetical protein